jgi:hypothetical protein
LLLFVGEGARATRGRQEPNILEAPAWFATFSSPEVFGDGDVDFVFFPGFVSNIELYWDELTREIEVAESDGLGIAVHVAARVAALADKVAGRPIWLIAVVETRPNHWNRRRYCFREFPRTHSRHS